MPAARLRSNTTPTAMKEHMSTRHRMEVRIVELEPQEYQRTLERWAIAVSANDDDEMDEKEELETPSPITIDARVNGVLTRVRIKAVTRLKSLGVWIDRKGSCCGH